MPGELVCVACGGIHDRRGWGLCGYCFTPHHDERIKATYAVGKAVARGEMPKADTLTCVDCGEPAHGYDHRDYTKPLEVDPVCRSCNHKRGLAFNSFWRPQPEAATA